MTTAISVGFFSLSCRVLLLFVYASNLAAAEDPCATIDCPSGSVCQLINVTCITTPCNPIAQCQPISSANSTETCGEHQTFKTCSSMCEPSCMNKNPMCQFMCGRPACQCELGFFRDASGHCVSEQECLRQESMMKMCPWVRCNNSTKCEIILYHVCNDSSCHLMYHPHCLPKELEDACKSVQCNGDYTCRIIQRECYPGEPCIPGPECVPREAIPPLKQPRGPWQPVSPRGDQSRSDYSGDYDSFEIETSRRSHNRKDRSGDSESFEVLFSSNEEWPPRKPWQNQGGWVPPFSNGANPPTTNCSMVRCSNGTTCQMVLFNPRNCYNSFCTYTERPLCVRQTQEAACSTIKCGEDRVCRLFQDHYPRALYTQPKPRCFRNSTLPPLPQNPTGNHPTNASTSAAPKPTCAHLSCPTNQTCKVINGSAMCMSAASTVPTQCGENEIHTNCVPDCQTSCRGVPECSTGIRVCHAGCVCKDGYRRNGKGKCVMTKYCYQDPGCKAHESWTKCATCETKCFGDSTCTKCYSGCGCDDGFARNSSQLCTPIDSCA